MVNKDFPCSSSVTLLAVGGERDSRDDEKWDGSELGPYPDELGPFPDEFGSYPDELGPFPDEFGSYPDEFEPYVGGPRDKSNDCHSS